MISRVVSSIIFVSCLFALFLSIAGVSSPVWFGEQFRSFIVSTNYEIQNSWVGSIRIPDIPIIPNVGFLGFSGNAWANVIVLLNNFFNGIASVINGIITILNFVILFLNTIIQLLSFILIFLKNIIILRDNIVG